MVRVGFPGGPRLEYYDRDPSWIRTSFVWNSIGPHARVQRIAYTVPTGKKAFLTSLALFFVRATAPTTPGQVEASCMLGVAYISGVYGYPAAVDASKQMELSQSVVLIAGTIIDCFTADLSTGGTIDYSLCMTLVEFSS